MAQLRIELATKSPIDGLSRSLLGWLTELEVKDLFRTCATCAYFKDDRHCQKFNADPPGSVIITGCDQYEDQEKIPF